MNISTLRITGICLTMSIVFLAQAQSQRVGMPYIEAYLRHLQLKTNKPPATSLTVRPLSLHVGVDTLVDGLDSSWSYQSLLFIKKKFKVGLFPLMLTQQYNSHHPFGWNDGSLVPAKGYQALALGGVFLHYGLLRLQVQPELVYAQNSNYPGFPRSYSDSIWKAYYAFQNIVDAPDRFGNKAYRKFYPGQSHIKLQHKKLSFGLSTENLWWGPGRVNSLTMSNTAPGLPHVSFESVAPLNTPIGSLEWQLISGFLQPSGFYPIDTGRRFEGEPMYKPKRNEGRYLNGIVLTWQPRWAPGLYIGISRAFYQYRSDVPNSLSGYLPVLASTFENNSLAENTRGRDQILSLFTRYVLPNSGFELYGEFGRNDRALNLRDILLEPEHARAYIIGFQKAFVQSTKKSTALFFEMTQTQLNNTPVIRDVNYWYTHNLVPHGYTHHGQLLGAGIGFGGSNSQTLGLDWFNDHNHSSIRIDRVVRQNDFYYSAFGDSGNFMRHWVDLALSGEHSWRRKRFIFSGKITLVRSLNYQWRQKQTPEGDKDVFNLFTHFTVGYKF